MTSSQADSLAAKIEKSIGAPRGDLPGQAARALATIAIADHLKDQGESILKPMVEQWWRGGASAKLARGQEYPLLELLHAVRDNVTVDLRESAADYFKDFPLDHLLGHYPAPLRGPENDSWVPVYSGDADPDPKDAALSRAAGLAMVAYDSNFQEVQYLQGWLMQDRFSMRDPFGSVYEFLWANPYQPGLSYALLPLVFHNAVTGITSSPEPGLEMRTPPGSASSKVTCRSFRGRETGDFAAWVGDPARAGWGCGSVQRARASERRNRALRSQH